MYDSQKVIPTSLEFVDIAGLISGASRGEGLGNQFLAHIREVDAVAHVIRAFEDDDIVHVSDHIDPLEDIESIQMELACADIETLNHAVERVKKASKAGDKNQERLLRLFERTRMHLDQSWSLRLSELTEDEVAVLEPLCLLTSKPMVYIANAGENQVVSTKHIGRIRERAATDNAEIVEINARIEEELSFLAPSERADFLQEIGFKESCLDRVIRSGYWLLGLHTFFSTSQKEVRAWTIEQGTKAPQAAGKIHTDFERGFIRAETISYDDFIDCRGEQGAKQSGRLRVEGRDYVVQDGDIINFRFNV